jgi:hypothetical protein
MAQRPEVSRKPHLVLASVPELLKRLVIKVKRQRPRDAVSIKGPESNGHLIPSLGRPIKWEMPSHIRLVRPSLRYDLKDEMPRKKGKYVHPHITEGLNIEFRIIDIPSPAKVVSSAKTRNPDLGAIGNGERRPKLAPNVSVEERVGIRRHMVGYHGRFEGKNSQKPKVPRAKGNGSASQNHRLERS